MNKLAIILCLTAVIQISAAVAQEQSPTEKVDSIVALLPQLDGEEKLYALAKLISLTVYSPEEKQYLKMYLDEARKQKNIQKEAEALDMLTGLYYAQFDTDSVFIYGEQTIRLAREHKLYNELFNAQESIIRRHQTDEQLLTALRKAEEAYAEAVEQSAEETVQRSRPAQEQEDEPFRRLERLMREQRLFTDSELKRKDIAEKIGISDRGLHDCVKNNTGMSFTDYLNRLRLHYACELLLQKGKKHTIEAIALDAGFSTRMTFYRFFREKYGLTPDEFKKMNN